MDMVEHQGCIEMTDAVGKTGLFRFSFFLLSIDARRYVSFTICLKSRVPNENIVQNHLNIALLNVF